MEKVLSSSQDLKTTARISAIVVGLAIQTYLFACWWLYPKLALVTFVKLSYTFKGEDLQLGLSLALLLENGAFVVLCLLLFADLMVYRRLRVSLWRKIEISLFGKEYY